MCKPGSTGPIAPVPPLYRAAATINIEEDMTSQQDATFTGRYSQATILPPRVRTLGVSGLLNSIIISLLSIFVFVLPTDLRIYDGKSIAMRVGYLCVMLGLAGVVKRGSFTVPSLGWWCLLAFVIWSTCTLAWATYPSFAIHKVLTYWALFIIGSILPQYAWDRQVRMRLFDAYIAGCWCGVIGVFMQYASGVPFTIEGSLEFEGRYSFSTDPNYLALALVIGLPIAVHRAAYTDVLWKKRLLLVYVPAGLAAIVLTGSRGAVIALLSAVVVFGLFTTVRTRAALLSGAALCLILAFAIPSDLLGRFVTIPDELSHGTLSDRRELWDRGTALVEEHPLQGIGAGATAGAFSVAAHNTPLELSMEGGIVGFALFYVAFVLGLYKVWRVNRQERLVLLAICVTWLVGTFSLSWEVDTVTWFVLAMLFSAGSVKERNLSASGMRPELAM